MFPVVSLSPVHTALRLEAGQLIGAATRPSDQRATTSLYRRVHVRHGATRDVQLGRRWALEGLVPARCLDRRGTTALLRGAVRRRRGRLTVLRAAGPRRDEAMGRAHARPLHLPRQGRGRDDLPRRRADRRSLCCLPRLGRAPRAVGKAARGAAPVPPPLRQVDSGEAGAGTRAGAARSSRAPRRVPTPLMDGGRRAIRHSWGFWR
jgi:hypothetical protein